MKNINPLKMMDILRNYYHYQIGLSSYGKNKWHFYANNKKNHFTSYADTQEKAIEFVFKKVLDQNNSKIIAG